MAELVSEMPRKYPYFSSVMSADRSWVAFVSSVENINVTGLFTERDQADLSAAVYELDALVTATQIVGAIGNDGRKKIGPDDFLNFSDKLNKVLGKIRTVLERQKCEKLG
jgi:hypothetical protein